jgi:ectoine hydroxylase-related dioxygenase (phytanoyl-CoA dioxygenase family)
MDRASKLRPDGITDTFNLWIALTEATPLNGCMYIVPANFDPLYGTDVAQPKFPLQSIRALPVPAGSILGWNGRVWHWGGRSSTKATHPRISIAKEFQRGDVAPHEHPALDPFVRLSLSERLGLAGLHILKYRAYPS